ncbi:MAG TPA: methyltransferase domain-containing protein [Anaerolineaceae bacterium]
MNKISDQNYLKNSQYKTSSNLNARIYIHQRFSANRYGWYRWVTDRMRLASGQTVIEVGGGTGMLWRERLSSLPASLEVTITDLSTGMLAEAAQALSADPRFRFACADVMALPFDSAACDLAVANHMLYHVPHILRGVMELRRVLKPGGMLIAATNGLNHLKELHELIRSVAPAYIPGELSAQNFGLENGMDILSEVFDDVRLEIYEDSLWITEALPLVDYIYSLNFMQAVTEADRSSLLAQIESRIQQEGGFYIQKASGLFMARV